MSHIQYDGSGELHITNITEARTIDKSGIDRVITVCQDSIEDNVSDECVYSYHRMSDGPDNAYGGYHSYYMFEQAADELYEALAAGEAVLIHCHHGTSRSVSVASAALGRLLDVRRSQAIDIIHYYRPRPSFPDRLLMSHATEYIEAHTGRSDEPTTESFK